MKDKDIRDYSEDEFGLFAMSELTKLNDIELTILKGHILIEFSINCYLESISRGKKMDFFKENFTFNSKIKILSHFGNLSGSEGEYFIKSLEVLNKNRNIIAHSLKINNQLIKEFLAILKKISPKEANLNNEKLTELYRFECGIAFICGVIFGKYCKNREINS